VPWIWICFAVARSKIPGRGHGAAGVDDDGVDDDVALIMTPTPMAAVP